MAFWSSNTSPGHGQMQERQEERPAVQQGQSTATAEQHQGGFVANEQNLWEVYSDGSSHPFTGSLDTQPSAVNNAFNTAYYANGGAFPVSASLYASVPLVAPAAIDTNNTAEATSTTFSNASHTTKNRLSDVLPSAASGLGPVSAVSTFNVSSPTPSPALSLEGRIGPGDIQRNITPSNVVKPPSTGYDLPSPSNPPKPGTSERKPLPSQRQQFNSFTGAPSFGAAPNRTATAQAEARPVSSSLAINTQSSSSSQPQNGSTGVQAPKPAHVPASTPALVSKPNDGSGGVGANKPVMKMRRTGQNFPLSSVGSPSPLRMPASLHQRTSSYSPSGRSAPGFPSVSLPKASGPIQGKAAGSSLPGDEASKSLVSKPPDTGVDTGAPSEAHITSGQR